MQEVTASQRTAAAVDIFWTSGLDSTFRVLDLLFNSRRVVQPHYLLDLGRGSMLVELRAMARIRSAIAAADPDAGTRLLTTIYRSVEEVRSNVGITRAYCRIRDRVYIGSQYDWLARYCRQEGISRMEMCIHHYDKWLDVMGGHIRESNKSNGTWVPDLASCSSDVAAVFGSYEFPILRKSKMEMQSAAREGGFSKLLDMTWFCHSPDIWGRPCGICNPCFFTIKEGMGHRIPLYNRVKYYLGVPHVISATKRIARAIVGRGDM